MELSEKQRAELILKLANTQVTHCIQCGRCTASCPVAYKMDMVPSRMVWALINGRADALMAANSPWKCLSCYACAARCPRGVSPASIMEAVRLTEIRRQGANHLQATELEGYPEAMPQQALVAAFRKLNK